MVKGLHFNLVGLLQRNILWQDFLGASLPQGKKEPIQFKKIKIYKIHILSQSSSQSMEIQSSVTSWFRFIPQQTRDEVSMKCTGIYPVSCLLQQQH